MRDEGKQEGKRSQRAPSSIGSNRQVQNQLITAHKGSQRYGKDMTTSILCPLCLRGVNWLDGHADVSVRKGAGKINSLKSFRLFCHTDPPRAVGCGRTVPWSRRQPCTALLGSGAAHTAKAGHYLHLAKDGSEY